MCLYSSSRIAQAFSHSSWAGFQENIRKCERPLEAWAQNWHWHFYCILLAKASHKVIPDSRGRGEAPKFYCMGHAQKGVENCGQSCSLPQIGTSITAISHIRKLRLKEVKMSCPNYAASKRGRARI